MAKTHDWNPSSVIDPGQPRPPEAPRSPGHKAAEPNEQPRRPGDDEREAGLVGGASPTAPAATVNPEAQRAAEEKIRRETRT